MNQKVSKSTRLRLLVVGVLLAVGREVAGYMGFEVSTDVLLMVEGMLMAVAGLDTIRPLGAGKGAEPEAVAEPEPTK